jgi:protein-tyrosine phosphatase
MTSPPPAWPDTLPPPRDPAGPYRICLVCLGNICRSPMAEAALRAALDRAGLSGAVTVDSAGTGDWHVGNRMDARARAELTRRGYDGAPHRARQIAPSWLAERDLVLAMDKQNLSDLRWMADQARAGDQAGAGDRAGVGARAGAGDRAGAGARAGAGDQTGGDGTGPERIRLLRSFDPDSGPDAEVPDPYYGEGASFGTVLDLVEAAAAGLAGALAAALAGERQTGPGTGR